MENQKTMQDKDFAIQLLRQVNLLKSSSFSGIGLVFYYYLDALPNIPLGGPAATKPELPTFGRQAIAHMLANVSNYSSNWHDGFHMIDMQSQSLTHISQFLAPPLNDLVRITADVPRGARQMTALLSSKLPGIAYAGVLGTGDEILLYKNGRISERETKII